MLIAQDETRPHIKLALDDALSRDFWRTLVHRRLSNVLHSAQELLFDDTSKIVFFSDCHRGNRGRADAFAPNEFLFLRALSHYFRQGFTYVEVGDGDELWQNRRFRDVLHSHWPIFRMLHRFDLQDRLHLIVGNHDVPQRRWRQRHKDGMRLQEGLVLRHRTTQQRILVTHGHQADIVSDRLSTFSRLLVRYVWRYVQSWKLPRFFQRDHREFVFKTIERRIFDWVESCSQAIICGHTHRAMIADYGDAPYFNTGSCITPGMATGLELQRGEIQLVRWVAHPITRQVRREVISSPRKMHLFA